MAYDSANHEMVLFGGENTSDGRLGDTWTWNGSDWTRESPTQSPSARTGSQMVYDSATSQLLLVGGETDSGPIGDTWTWDGSNWTQLAPAHPLPALAFHSMADDPTSGNVVLFGGTSSGVPKDWTWIWNGTDWAQLSPPSSPPARDLASMAYDAAAGNIVLAGGFGDDTWTWNGSTWTKGASISDYWNLAEAGMAFSPATDSVIMFGGTFATASVHLAITDATQSWNSSQWSVLDPYSSPEHRFGSAMALDPESGMILLFGGQSIAASPYGDTWTYGLQTDQSPVADISDPAGGIEYQLGEWISTEFACSPAQDGPPVSSCVDSNGDGASRGRLDTSTLGHHTYTVTATAADGQTGNAEITYDVTKAVPSLMGLGATSNTLGKPISDQVQLNGGYFATGTVTFRAYGPAGKSTCSGKPAFTSSPVTAAPYVSPPFTPARKGVYHWQASYSGDADNEPVKSDCGGSGATSTVSEAACRKVSGGFNPGTFVIAPPFGSSREVPGLRVRLEVGGVVDAKIFPTLTYAVGNDLRTSRLKPRTVRIDRHRNLRFMLPEKVRRQMVGAGGPVYGVRVGFRVRVKLKARGDRASCFRDAGRRMIRLRVVPVSGRVALRGR